MTFNLSFRSKSARIPNFTIPAWAIGARAMLFKLLPVRWCVVQSDYHRGPKIQPRLYLTPKTASGKIRREQKEKQDGKQLKSQI